MYRHEDYTVCMARSALSVLHFSTFIVDMRWFGCSFFRTKRELQMKIELLLKRDSAVATNFIRARKQWPWFG